MTESELDRMNFNMLTWMTTKEAAIYLRVSVNNLNVMICRGVVKPYKLNNRNRFRRDDLDNLIKSSLKGTRR
jgi:excisionase family DNA binding protein